MIIRYQNKLYRVKGNKKGYYLLVSNDGVMKLTSHSNIEIVQIQ